MAAKEFGVPPKYRVLSRPMLRVAGWFNPLVRESYEMLYQSDSPYRFDSTILFTRDGTLMAQPFDADRLHVSGQPVPVTDGLPADTNGAWPFISVSENGVLVYSSVSGQPNERILVWVDRQGKAQP